MKKSKIPYPKEYFMYKWWANCRLCGNGLGDSDLLTPDSKYLFPELWWHYIEEHSVKPKNEDFIQDALDYYNTYKDGPQETKTCPICNKVFGIDHRNNDFCSGDCGRLDSYLKFDHWEHDLNAIENIAINKNLNDVLEKVIEHKACLVTCSYCGRKTRKKHSKDPDICETTGCEFLYHKLSDNVELSIKEIMELNQNDYITNYLLKKFHNLNVSRIQRVIKGSEIQYIILGDKNG